MTTSEKIIEFLQDHPLISINGLAKETGFENLAKALAGERTIPEKYEAELVKTLKNYGFKHNPKWETFTDPKLGKVYKKD